MAGKPTYIAYTVRNYEHAGAQKGDWTRIGAAWTHQDGKGFDIVLESIPLSGKVTLRANEPKLESAAGA